MNKLLDRIKDAKPGILVLNVAVFLIASGVIGFSVRALASNINNIMTGKSFKMDWTLLLDPITWAIGAGAFLIFGLVYFIMNYKSVDSSRMKEK
ncbi:MAG: hypothetical protein IKI20_01515 [Lachnospiraceae bacterium]|nr:hypothetical protein [Lachnospiraceae bacterium]